MDEGSYRVTASKAKGNAFMKNEKYVEAIMEYTEGIALQPANPLLYSNRSLAFLKLGQYFFARKDAETTIRLVPDWSKGHYRKGQAELAAGMFELAIATYTKGLESCPCDEALMKAMDEAKNQQTKYLTFKRQSVQRYTICAALIGLLIVIADMVSQPSNKFISRPWLRGLLVTFSGFIGYIFRSIIISLHHSTKTSLLHPPPELLTGANLDYLPMKSHGSSSPTSGL